MLRSLFCSDWVVYSKLSSSAGRNTHSVIWAGYAHRVAISNHRLVAFGGGRGHVPMARLGLHNNKKRLMQLPLEEFLRRFFLHVLPNGFVRIRHFGFFAHRRRAALLPLCLALLRQTDGPQAVSGPTPPDVPRPLWLCPQCGGAMAVVERFTASQARLRAPPAHGQPL